VVVVVEDGQDEQVVVGHGGDLAEVGVGVDVNRVGIGPSFRDDVGALCTRATRLTEPVSRRS